MLNEGIASEQLGPQAQGQTQPNSANYPEIEHQIYYKYKRRRSGSSKMQESSSPGLRRWEDLDINILKNIFRGIDSQELALYVSPVCYSWTLACWDVLFWGKKLLDFSLIKASAIPEYVGHMEEGLISKNIELKDENLRKPLQMIMNGKDAYGFPLENWRLSIESIIIPEDVVISDETLLHLAIRTPNLESLALFGTSRITVGGFIKAIQSWKNVKHMSFEDSRIINHGAFITEIVKEMGKNCPDLKTLLLSVMAIELKASNAQAIIKNMPKLKVLKFEYADLYREGIGILFFNYLQLEEVHFYQCCLMDETAPEIHGMNFTIRFKQLKEKKWVIELGGEEDGSDLDPEVSRKFDLWMRGPLTISDDDGDGDIYIDYGSSRCIIARHHR